MANRQIYTSTIHIFEFIRKMIIYSKYSHFVLLLIRTRKFCLCGSYDTNRNDDFRVNSFMRNNLN